MLPFQQAVSSELESVNSLIIKQLHSDVGLVENIGHYIVDAGGKRLRPILVLLSSACLANGNSSERGIELATIIEFIHTATLLHDDVVDVSSLRRGRPTANAEYGNAPSVLVGDFLYSRAFQMLVALGSMPIMAILSNTTNIIAEGEVQQLVNAKNPKISEADYFTVIHKKTAALFEAACQSAAILVGADEGQQQAAWQFGHHLGQAFQLVDDLLDYEGSQEAMGKNIGDDLMEGKATLPLIYALKNSGLEQQTMIRQAITDGVSDNLENIIKTVQQSGGLEYTRTAAKKHAKQAHEALNAMPENQYLQAMRALINFAVERTY